MQNRLWMVVCSSVAGSLLGGLVVLAQNKPAALEQERKVKEAEVPKAALDALKKIADKAAITEFAEEIEHGSKFFEGTWIGPAGKVDCLVTETGDLVEIEETIPADTVPAATKAAAEKEIPKDSKVVWERKTVIMYEVHYKKGEKAQEIIFTPDGRQYHEQGEKKGEEDKDDGDE